MPTTEEDVGPRSGHLDTAWEAAVVAAFVVVLIGVIIVVIVQVRKRNQRRQRRELESEEQPQSQKGKQLKQPAEKESRDLERGMPPAEVPASLEDGEYVDEDEDEEPEDSKKSKRMSRTSTKSKPARTKKAPSIRSTEKTDPESYYFEHPSQKPPKYYWSYR